MRGTMAGYRRLLRFAHAGQLIAGFNRTVEIQVVQHRFRVDVFRRNAEIAGALLGITDIADALTLRRQLLRDRIGVGQRHQFEGLGPETVRQRLYAVPVVNRGVEPQLWLVDAIYPQPAVRHRCHRHPGFEMRVHFERVAMVVQKYLLQFPGVNQQRIQLVAFQHFTRAFLQFCQVVVIQRSQRFHHSTLMP